MYLWNIFILAPPSDFKINLLFFNFTYKLITLLKNVFAYLELISGLHTFSHFSLTPFKREQVFAEALLRMTLLLF